jgi:hypothetical protein
MLHPHSRNKHVIISRSPVLQTDAKRIGPPLPLGRSHNGRAQTFGRQELSVFPRSNQVTHSLLDMAVSSVYNGPSLLSETLSERRRTAVPRTKPSHICAGGRGPHGTILEIAESATAYNRASVSQRSLFDLGRPFIQAKSYYGTPNLHPPSWHLNTLSTITTH